MMEGFQVPVGIIFHRYVAVGVEQPGRIGYADRLVE